MLLLHSGKFNFTLLPSVTHTRPCPDIMVVISNATIMSVPGKKANYKFMILIISSVLLHRKHTLQEMSMRLAGFFCLFFLKKLIKSLKCRKCLQEFEETGEIEEVIEEGGSLREQREGIRELDSGKV